MCTLIVATRWYADWPLIIAANRDEALDRPAAPPTVREQGGLPFLAPTDLLAGGTWLGLNSAGLFVGITNRFGVPVDPARASRGALVTRALGHDRASAAFADLRTVDPGQNNGFHLVMADVDGAFLVRGDGQQLVAEALPAGQHVITERSFAAGPTRRDPLVQAELTQPYDSPAPPVEVWQDLLRTRAEPSFEGVLVHWPERNYGTRSSTILMQAEDDVRMWHAHGRPDEVPFVDYASSARALRAP